MKGKTAVEIESEEIYRKISTRLGDITNVLGVLSTAYRRLLAQ